MLVQLIVLMFGERVRRIERWTGWRSLIGPGDVEQEEWGRWVDGVDLELKKEKKK